MTKLKIYNSKNLNSAKFQIYKNVGQEGLEPSTFRLWDWRAADCATVPQLIFSFQICLSTLVKFKKVDRKIENGKF